MACVYTFLKSIAVQRGDGAGLLRHLAEVEIVAQIKLLIKISRILRAMPRHVSKDEILSEIDRLASELMSQLEIVISSP